MTKNELEQYHKLTNNYDVLILNTQICGCFFCCQFFVSDTIKEFTNDGCALCPFCGIDTIIPLTCWPDMTKELLEEMYLYWFESGQHNYLGTVDGKITQCTDTNYGWQHLCLAPQDRKIMVRTKAYEYPYFDEVVTVPEKEFEVIWNPKGLSWVDNGLKETGNWTCGNGWLEPCEVNAWQEIKPDCGDNK